MLIIMKIIKMMMMMMVMMIARSYYMSMCAFNTHADDSRESIAFIRFCLSVCVILSVRTIKPKRLKLKSPNLAHG